MVWMLAQGGPPLPDGPGLFRSVAALTIVLGLLALSVWLVRRGGLALPGRTASRAMRVETALPLGDRRQLVIVRVEGRRLLLGLSAMHVSLLTELSTEAAFADALDALDARMSPDPEGC
jgi:flagellar biosynthetic protein FliO